MDTTRPRLQWIVITLLAALSLPSIGTATAQTALPSAIVCPSGTTLRAGTEGRDSFKGSRVPECEIGGGGNDYLRGKDGNDVLDPGPGIDKSLGGLGDDVFEIRGGCEVGKGELVHGGRGTDTVRSPLSRDELKRLGVRLQSIERFEKIESAADGGCVAVPGGTACTCCNQPGFDPAAGCRDCQAGFYLNEPADGLGDTIGSPGESPDTIGSPVGQSSCIQKTTCADLNCGNHGSCVSVATGAACACDAGYAGESCSECDALYEPRADGRCVLGDVCARERCGGHGVCVQSGENQIACRCDEGWDTDASCGGDDAFVGGPGFVPWGGGATTFGVALHNGAHCTTNFTWSVVSGAGIIEADPRDSHRAIYTPPTALSEPVAHATLRAECANNASLASERNVTIGGPPPPNRPPDPSIGTCDPKLADELDKEMLSYMADNELTGGTVAVMYRENVVCLRAYGNQSVSALTGTAVAMEPCTPMRVASVTKPFTRAAFRGNLFGTVLPEGDKGGEDTLAYPILAPTMGVNPNDDMVEWQAPAALYSATYPPLLPYTFLPQCSSSDGLINESWKGITVNKMLGHRAGFNPNQDYKFGAFDTSSCDPDVPDVNEACGSSKAVGDPTVWSSTVTRMANDLGLDHGLVTMNDVTKWMAGICLYDAPEKDRSRYSNVGFTMAGKVIENLTRQTYEEYLVNFLKNDGIVDLEAPGNPVVYVGKSKGGGPRTYSLPDFMQEADYFTHRGDITDVTEGVFDMDKGIWTYPNTVKAPYGGTNYDIMAPHGGLVMNALALVKFGSVYNIGTGRPRSLLRGGPGLTTYDPENTGLNHNGLLWGTFAEVWELPTTDPVNDGNPNGPGCYTRDANKGVLQLDSSPCPVPPGLRIGAIFNDEPRGTNPGLHDYSLVKHAIRTALSRVGTTAEEWNKITPLDDVELGIDCEYKCPPNSFCVPVACGNGELDEGEQCDDGNNEGNDECSADCQEPFEEPNGYTNCEGEDPGTCLGGPCAPRLTEGVTDTLQLDSFSPAHPDGDWSPDTFCHDSHTGYAGWEEATCVREEVVDNKFFGMCKQCGVDTMTGCECPAPNQEDGGCNGNFFEGYSCIGGRCWDTPKPPNWMCDADCTNIYDDEGFCLHEGVNGPVCYQAFCSEPTPPDWGYCDELGKVCDADVDGCEDDSCCKFECTQDADCAKHSEGHTCKSNRCVLG